MLIGKEIKRMTAILEKITAHALGIWESILLMHKGGDDLNRKERGLSKRHRHSRPFASQSCNSCTSYYSGHK